MFGDEDRGSRGSEQTAGEGGNRAVPRAEGGGNGGGNAGAAGEASKALGDEVKVREKKKKRDAKAGRDGPGPGEADMKNKAKKKHEEDPSTEGLTGDAEAPDSAEIHGKKRRLEGKVAKKKKSKAGGA